MFEVVEGAYDAFDVVEAVVRYSGVFLGIMSSRWLKLKLGSDLISECHICDTREVDMASLSKETVTMYLSLRRLTYFLKFGWHLPFLLTLVARIHT